MNLVVVNLLIFVMSKLKTVKLRVAVPEKKIVQKSNLSLNLLKDAKKSYMNSADLLKMLYI